MFYAGRRMSMFRKILIANRGEIACRVMASARRMGIGCVAVYSDADAGALHVAQADEAVRIGPAPAAESYLDGDAIIAAALGRGAEAIHPGYGFLSENPEFVRAVEAAGLVFIGPSADAIEAMGLKDAAKAAMEAAGVRVVPGYHGADQDAGVLADAAAQIGYPVLIKARAGGGGKGMRLVERASDFAAALEGAQREGAASFGDRAVLVEKYIAQPRHIEVQVFGDAHGNVVHLFERDCSLQRRHQKVIEEAPAPGMTDEMRDAMGKAAVDAAKAIGYVGAGTVEFIVDGRDGLHPDQFWFMEMNTRLQVEHPVTEAITGLDLVELQLQVAAGEALPFAQRDLAVDGHAFEARIYAEDAGRDFLPSIGALSHLEFPQGATFERSVVRVDSGVAAKDVVSPYYDPMIAKLIVHGRDRAAALAQLRAALAQVHVAGCTTNVGFLAALATHEGFAAGDVDTGLIARDMGRLLGDGVVPDDVRAVAALVALGLLETRGDDPWVRLTGWRHWSFARLAVDLAFEGDARSFGVSVLGEGRFDVDGTVFEITRDGDRIWAGTGAHRRTMAAHADDAAVTVFADARTYRFERPMRAAANEDAGGDAVFAPMPGLVKAVDVAVGDAVAAGDALMVLEAMKMEHTLVAPRNGVVARLAAAVGDQVTDGALMIALEPGDG